MAKLKNPKKKPKSSKKALIKRKVKPKKKRVIVGAKKIKLAKVIKAKISKKKISKLKVINKKTEAIEVSRSRYTPKLLRGMKDILPEDQIVREYLIKKLVKLSKAYGFQEIITPILEERALFEKSTGIATDIVEKQMYQFTDRSGKKSGFTTRIYPFCRASIY